MHVVSDSGSPSVLIEDDSVLARLTAARTLIVSGKGGVGKSTVGASVARAAARDGCDVLLIELEGYSSLGAVFGVDGLGIEPVEVPWSSDSTQAASGRAQAAIDSDGTKSGSLRLMQLRPDEALAAYLQDNGLGPLVRALSRTGAVDVVATAAPGIRDLVVLGKIRQLEQAGVADLIVVDAPASGHTRTLLTTPGAMAESSPDGRIRDQADEVLDLLADPARCQVVLVTLAEHAVVTETIETAYDLEERVDVALGPVVVNGLWPEIEGLDRSLRRAEREADRAGTGGKGDRSGDTDGAAAIDEVALDLAHFRLDRVAAQKRAIEFLAAELPIPQIHLPHLFNADLGLDDIDTLAGCLRSPGLHSPGLHSPGRVQAEGDS